MKFPKIKHLKRKITQALNATHINKFNRYWGDQKYNDVIINGISMGPMTLRELRAKTILTAGNVMTGEFKLYGVKDENN